jgi:tetratricopeptide (TPR) repeat protein
MESSEKKIYSGCLFVFCIFVILIIWIRCSDSEDEAKAQRYQKLMAQISREPDAEKAIVLFNEAYENATSWNERRRAKSGVITLYEQMGKYSEAHRLLDAFVDEFESSKFTDIHRALLFGKEGKTDKAIEIFESVLAINKEYKEPGMLRKMWNSFMVTGSSESYLTNYYDYFFDYVCNMVALGYESVLIKDSIERLKSEERLFSLNPQIDEVAQSYIDFKSNLPKSYGGFEEEKLDIMQKMHLSLWVTPISIDNIIEDIYRMKWNFATLFLLEYDGIYGYQKTKNKMRDILRRNHTSSEKFPTFLIDAYMSMESTDKKSRITYDEFRNFSKGSMSFLVKLTPATFLTEESSFIKEGITDSRILLQCNDWHISHGTNFLPDSVAKYQGYEKHLVLLSDDYTLDTINIQTDKLGVRIEHVMVPTALYEMLLHDFSNCFVNNDK